MELMKKELIEKALNMGAKKAKVFTIEDISFDNRAMLKCLFGCPGGLPYCPTKENATNIDLYISMAKKYKWGVILETDNLPLGQEITLELERTAFLGGYHLAFGTTECANCESCNFEDRGECISKKVVRPPLYALGIDVYSTAKNIGWELKVVQEKEDPAKNITAVFVE